MKLLSEQKQTYSKPGVKMIVHLSIKDFGDGQYFAIGGEIDGKRDCLHHEIAALYPEFAHLIKWHLFYVDHGPIHYLKLSMLQAQEGDLESARWTAKWPDAQLEDFTEEKLMKRLPALIENFKTEMRRQGFRI